MPTDAERKPGAQRVHVNTSVAVRGETGFFFGTLKWIEEKRILAEVDAELADGEALDVRITLSPTPATALFRGFVGRALVTAPGETPRYLIGIYELAEDDREKFEAWLKNVRSRGTFSNFDTVLSDSGSADRSTSDVRHALERMARKPLGGLQTDPFGARSDLATNGTPGSGRGAVRDALRSALARRGTGAPMEGAPRGTPPEAPGRVVASSVAPPERPDRSDQRQAGTRSTDSRTPGRVVASVPPDAQRAGAEAPGRLVASIPPDAPGYVRIGGDKPRSVPPTPSNTPDAPGVVRIGGDRPRSVPPGGPPPGVTVAAEPRPVHPPVRDPVYATTTTKTATWMEVRWHDREAFERDARLQLCNYALSLVKDREPLPDREPLRVVLRHADLQVECAASIKAMGPNGATYRLLLDALQLEQLRTWLGDYGTK